MFTKEELKKIFDELFNMYEATEEYRELKEAGCNILAAFITTTTRFKKQYYNLWMKPETFDFSVYPNLKEPSKDVYSEEEILEDIRKLPENKIFWLFRLTIAHHEKFPPKWIDLFLHIKKPGEEIKKYIEENPGLIVECGQSGCVQATKYFIENGIDMSLSGVFCKDAAIHFAAYNNHPEVMKMLLDIGRPIKDATAHVAASESGNPEVVKLAIQAGADYTKGYAAEAIVDVVEDGNIEMVKLLLEVGCDPTIKKYKAFEIARRKGVRGERKYIYREIYQLLDTYHRKQVFEQMSKANSSEEENIAKRI